MNVLYKGARLIKDMYNQLNPATLTGAIDILVIEQENEDLCASPFHVRFGKLGVLRAKEKLVNITINDEVVDLHMKLGDQGEAFFVVETDDEEIPARLLTSPLPSRPVSPTIDGKPENSRSISREETTVKRKRRKRRKRRSLSSPTNELIPEYSQSSDSEDEIHTQINSNLPGIEQSSELNLIHPQEPRLSLDVQDDEEDRADSYKRLCSVFSDSELPQNEEGNDSPPPESPFSDSEAMSRKQMETPLGWDWGQLPGEHNIKENNQNLTVPSIGLSKIKKENEKRYPKMSRMLEQDTPSQELPMTFQMTSELSMTSQTTSEIPSSVQDDVKESNQSPSSREGSPKKKSRRPDEGLYLDEILDLEPKEANLYFATKSKDSSQDLISSDTQDKGNDSSIDNARSRTPDAVFAGSDAGVDSGTDCVISDDIADTAEMNMSPIKMSLCGGKLEDGRLTVDEDKFNEKIVTYEQFMVDPVGITRNPELVILLGDRYCDWEAAGPLFLSLCTFKKPLSNEIMDRLIDKQISKKLRSASGGRLSWLFGRSQRDSTSSTHSEQGVSATVKENQASEATITPKTLLSKSYSASPALSSQTKSNGTDESSSCEDEISKLAIERKELKRAQTIQAMFPSTKSMRKTTRLTSEQLKSLNLKPGANEVSFSVTSQYQGTTRCHATIFLWKWTDRLVVSDIDGTITKSDVFGQILPVVGKDWTQGGVAQLYDNISKNGYKFIYLSARAIGQAGMTKGYLNWINQQGVCLPAGPLFLSPTSLIRAFRAEVIEKKPEKFKIQCLQNITELFPSGMQPLVAGFGNKINDDVAYTAVGIPSTRVFTINHRGELKQKDLQTYTTSYSELGDTVDTFFPALDSPHCKNFSDTQEYSGFNYWKTDLPEFEDDLNI